MQDQLFPILHEDAELLVINKPAGLVCHPTKTDVYSSLISRVRLYFGQTPSESASVLPTSSVPSPQLINRLDRETSGVTFIGKTPLAARELRRLWENRQVQKEYLAIVHGWVEQARGVIDAPLGKDEQSRVAIKDCVRPDGSPALTEFTVLSHFQRPLDAPPVNLEAGAEGPPTPTLPPPSPHAPRSTLLGTSERSEDGHAPTSPFTLLRVHPHTGRKHQIRIHLAHLGHPIVGDKLYGGDEDLYLSLVENRLTAAQRTRLVLPCHALHACAVRFAWRGREMDFTAPPEPWFSRFAGMFF